MFTDTQKAALSAKLDPANVKTRTQSGRSLSYVEGWHAIAEANRIFGFDAWSRETIEIRCVSERERKMSSGDGWGVTYIAKVRVRVGDIVREGCGTGHGIDRDLGQAHESALKEAETDAMKRALMTFGNPFGLALYDKEQAQVGCGDAPSIVAQAADSLMISTEMVEAIRGCDTIEQLTQLNACWKADGTYQKITDADYSRVSDIYRKAKAAKSGRMVDAGGNQLTNIHAG